MATPARLTLDATTPQAAGPASDTVQPGGSVVLFPQASGTILFGDSGMTTSTGARKAVTTGDVISIDIPLGETLYLMCASATLAVDVLRFG